MSGAPQDRDTADSVEFCLPRVRVGLVNGAEEDDDAEGTVEAVFLGADVDHPFEVLVVRGEVLKMFGDGAGLHLLGDEEGFLCCDRSRRGRSGEGQALDQLCVLGGSGLDVGSGEVGKDVGAVEGCDCLSDGGLVLGAGPVLPLLSLGVGVAEGGRGILDLL